MNSGLKKSSGSFCMAGPSIADNTISFDEKELQELIGLLDRKIHRVIELEQLIIFHNEILRDKFNKDPQNITPEEANKAFEAISSVVMDSASILRGLRNRIRSLATFSHTSKL